MHMKGKGKSIVNNQKKKEIVMLRKPVDNIDCVDMEELEAEVEKILGKNKRISTPEDTTPIFKDQLNIGRYYFNILSIFQNKIK